MKKEIKSLWILIKPNKKRLREEMICSKSKKSVCFPCKFGFCQNWTLITGEHCYQCSSRKVKKLTKSC